MHLLPKQFGETTVLQATFAVDHFHPSKRTLVIFLAQASSLKPRVLGYPANNDEDARLCLQKAANLSAEDADIIINAAHETQQSYERLAGKFIPAGSVH